MAGNWQRGSRLVPSQHSSCEKPTVGVISNRRDRYLRMLLINGTRAVIRVTDRQLSPAESWLKRLIGMTAQKFSDRGAGEREFPRDFDAASA